MQWSKSGWNGTCWAKSGKRSRNEQSREIIRIWINLAENFPVFVVCLLQRADVREIEKTIATGEPSRRKLHDFILKEHQRVCHGLN